MKNSILTLVFLLAGLNIYGQINMEDSTAQVVSYWEKGEKQNYTATFDMYKVEGKDTISKEKLTYDVEITVLEADEKSYTVEWNYKNAKTDSKLPVVKNLLLLTNGKKVVIKTDELGMFKEVINWKEVKGFIQNIILKAKKEYTNDDPEKDKFFQQIEAMYTTKEAIESSSIKDIIQFHNFHGAKYKLGEVLEGKTKQTNLYGPQPFDVDVIVLLDEINVEEDNFTVRSWQEINKEQLANATFNYLTKMASNMKQKPPTRDDVKNISNETYTSSVVHPTGWILFTIETKTVSQGNNINIEERMMEIK
ncbi:MAG: hypothetical protein IPN10_18105 [Saprospiraceae bacterium]|nr:hypothetical protein [Saprospiraceae bacterium]